jgi:Flp pilus assembly pilin Flp
MRGMRKLEKALLVALGAVVVLATTNIVVVIGLLAMELAEVDSLMRLGSGVLMGLIAFVVVMLWSLYVDVVKDSLR